MVVNAQTGTSSYGVYMRLKPHGPMQVSTLPVPLGGLGESSEYSCRMTLEHPGGGAVHTTLLQAYTF